MYLILTALFTLHCACASDTEIFNLYKNINIEPDLSRCHWKCPFTSDRLCGWDSRLRLHRVFLNPCFLQLHNKCFLTGFEPTSGLSKCQERYIYPETEVQQLKYELYGFPKNAKRKVLYGRLSSYKSLMSVEGSDQSYQELKNNDGGDCEKD